MPEKRDVTLFVTFPFFGSLHWFQFSCLLSGFPATIESFTHLRSTALPPYPVLLIHSQLPPA